MTPSAQITAWRDHPAQMVRDLFHVNPDPPQEELLELYPKTPKIAMKACTGAGKTAGLAWVAWNFLLTRPDPVLGVTSISADNLKANLWTELARWRNQCPLLLEMFEQTKTMVFLKERPSTHKLEARTWAKDADASQIGNALRGLHAPYLMWLLDETGEYPESILPVVEAIFSGTPTEAHIIQAGNPLRLAGPLYHACTKAKWDWHVIEITADPDDPKRTSRVSVEHARNFIKQWGLESAWTQVNIFGRFPKHSIDSLIGPDEVAAAQKRYWREHEIGRAAKIMGVDVARQGLAKSVICPRQGIQCFPLIVYRDINSSQGAGIVARKWNDWEANACFIDMTGGFGSGWYDQLINLGKTPIGVQFSNEAHRKERFFNKRAEMYFDAVEWIKAGGALPPSDELLGALTQTTYTHKGDRLILEPKEEIEQRLGYTLDDADAFVLTFAEPVHIETARNVVPRNAAAQPYSPFAELDRALAGSYADDPWRGR